MLKQLLSFVLLSVFLISCKRKTDRVDGQTSIPGYSESFNSAGMECVVTLDRPRLKSVDEATITVEVLADEDAVVELPELPERIGDLSVDRKIDPTPVFVPKKRKKRYKRSWRLEPFLPGEYEIPELAIGLHKKEVEGNKEVLKSKAIRLIASSALENRETPELADIADPVAVVDTHSWVYYVVTALLWPLLLIVGFLSFILVRKRRVELEPEEKKIDPAVYALGLLEALQKDQLPMKGAFKEYYLRLGNILRHYIEQRFFIRAPEQTTGEFLLELRRHREFSDEQRLILKRFMQHCDMVKFAELRPDSHEVNDSYGCVEAFVRETGKGNADAV